ncbi:MAG: effector binding domain-containing protein [Parachlamydiaceae bacterium]|nr:effector binding domain-containing protein [Parachlamydiaceae bacterium]
MNDFKVTQKPSVLLIGIQCRTSNDPDAGPKDIPELWEKFASEKVLENIPNKTSNDVIALYCDYEGDHTQPYTLVIGCAVTSFDSVPRGMVTKTIPASSYAVFQAVGEFPKSLIETWEKIWKTDLKRTYNGDLELYGEKFNSGTPKVVEVFIAITPS